MSDETRVTLEEFDAAVDEVKQSGALHPEGHTMMLLRRLRPLVERADAEARILAAGCTWSETPGWLTVTPCGIDAPDICFEEATDLADGRAAVWVRGAAWAEEQAARREQRRIDETREAVEAAGMFLDVDLCDAGGDHIQFKLKCNPHDGYVGYICECGGPDPHLRAIAYAREHENSMKPYPDFAARMAAAGAEYMVTPAGEIAVVMKTEDPVGTYPTEAAAETAALKAAIAATGATWTTEPWSNTTRWRLGGVPDSIRSFWYPQYTTELDALRLALPIARAHAKPVEQTCPHCGRKQVARCQSE